VSADPCSPWRLWWLAAGFGLWGSALVGLYTLHAVGCTFAWSAGPLRLGLAAVLLAHLVAIGWMWRDLAGADVDPDTGETGAFLHEAVVWTLIAAFAATVLTLGPPLALAMCV
jgi:hypothetical protein